MSTSSHQGAQKQETTSAVRRHEQENEKDRTPASPSVVLQRAYADPGTLTPTDVKTLQRTVGNRATTELLRPVLQKKDLTLGPANDRYEQEADRVAEQVVRHMDSAPATARHQPKVQRNDLEDEEMAQAKRAVNDAAFSPPSTRVKRTFQIQRAAEEQPTHGSEGGAVEQSVQQQIQAARGGGKSLPAGVRGQMEQGFGADFSNVRVHTGGQADTLNRSLNARAFTVGSDVFFKSGEYNPGSSGGKKLLAHELTHTVQQGAAGVQRKAAPKQRRLFGKSMVQRNYTPQGNEDPLSTYQQGDDSLFYGIGPYRGKTMGRMDNNQQQNKFPTIDQINDGVGIGQNMGVNSAGLTIFRIRKALENPQKWRDYLPGARNDIATHNVLSRWIVELANNKNKIGLYDVGDQTKTGLFGWGKRAGHKKINQKNRLTKNQRQANDLTSKEINRWLGVDTNTGYQAALNNDPTPIAQASGVAATKFLKLSEWISKAFFRRTSKQGVNFATNALNSKVYFNKAGNVGYKGPQQQGTKQRGGLGTASSTEDQSTNRAITTSEWRHVNKMINKGKINQNRVHFYDEYN